MEPGEVFPANPKGQCIFFDENTELCQIHPVKPYECREYTHRQGHKTVEKRHKWVAKQWKDHQKQLEKLLGDEPRAAEYSFLDVFSW
jgi:Fe-S-cluster containining protein